MKSLITFLRIYKTIYQHATIFSAVVVALIFGFFSQAYMHNFNLVYIALFFVFSLAFTAGPMGIINIGYVSPKFINSGRLFVEEDGIISLQIDNTLSQSIWALSLHNDDFVYRIPQIKPKNFITVPIPFTPTKRGEFILDNAHLESKYPLSTARLSMPVKTIFRGLAYPKPKGIPLKSFIYRQNSPFGEENEFDGLIEYDGSQSISKIHWASVAKGDISVKSFNKDRENPKLIFDFYTIGDNDEDRLSQLCLWTIECEKHSIDFTIIMPTQTIKSQEKSIDEILTILAKY